MKVTPDVRAPSRFVAVSILKVQPPTEPVCRLLLPAAPEQVLTVPDSAVVRAGQLTMVDVVEEGRVGRRTVQLGRAIGDRFEVFSGLTAGETVVLRNTRTSAQEKERL